jgi:hypothetical protein
MVFRRHKPVQFPWRAGSRGVFPPKLATNLNLVPSWSTNAVEITSPGAVLKYNVMETNNYDTRNRPR